MKGQSGQARQGRQNVAHGESRGKGAVIFQLRAPAGATEPRKLIGYFCRPSRGSLVLVPMFPWLAPWATFYRRSAAWRLYRTGSAEVLGSEPNSSAAFSYCRAMNKLRMRLKCRGGSQNATTSSLHRFLFRKLACESPHHRLNLHASYLGTFQPASSQESLPIHDSSFPINFQPASWLGKKRQQAARTPKLRSECQRYEICSSTDEAGEKSRLTPHP